jgi:glutathione S-transferase
MIRFWGVGFSWLDGWSGRSVPALSDRDRRSMARRRRAGRRATIADFDIYGVVCYAPEAGVDPAPYGHLVAWMRRIEALPGFGHPEDILPRENRSP